MQGWNRDVQAVLGQLEERDYLGWDVGQCDGSIGRSTRAESAELFRDDDD